MNHGDGDRRSMILWYAFNANYSSPPPAASLKSFGEKTAGLFDRKKKDAEKLAADKLTDAQKLAEEQARKVGEEIGKTKSEAEALAASTGERLGGLVSLICRWRKELKVMSSWIRNICASPNGSGFVYSD